MLSVPDGPFDVEVHAVLRRRDLNGVLEHEDIVAARLRLADLRVRRARVMLSARLTRSRRRRAVSADWSPKSKYRDVADAFPRGLEFRQQSAVTKVVGKH